MKTICYVLFFLVISSISPVWSADYTISFSGSGASNTLDSVVVQNLTKGSNITVFSGSDLTLSDITSIGNQHVDKRALCVYPNPIVDKSNISFYVSNQGEVQLNVFDFNGKVLIVKKMNLQEGLNTFQLSLQKGSYMLEAKGNGFSYSSKVVSKSAQKLTSDITYLGLMTPKSVLRHSLTDAVMLYTSGDQLIFKGMSGNYSTLVSDIPTSSKTINFEFVECKDASGKFYTTTKIGTQTWMAQNLAYLPSVNAKMDGSEDTGSASNPFYYVYGYDGTDVNAAKATSSYATTGVLYNWLAAKASAPQGWHIPTDAEWTILSDYLGGITAAGDKMRLSTGWSNQVAGAFNSSCFSAMAVGDRKKDDFINSSFVGYWWSATEYVSADAWIRYIAYNNSALVRQYYFKYYGFSVRCVKD